MSSREAVVVCVSCLPESGILILSLQLMALCREAMEPWGDGVLLER